MRFYREQNICVRVCNEIGSRFLYEARASALDVWPDNMSYFVFLDPILEELALHFRCEIQSFHTQFFFLRSVSEVMEPLIDVGINGGER